MRELDIARLGAALDTLPHKYPGPGGVAGVVKDGQIIAARAWGFADLTRRLPMTHATRLPICSITKQFTCGVLLATLGEPDRLDPRVAAFLPGFEGILPTVRQLCNNQSGLRDYWALTILHGALAEQSFAREDALPLIARMKTGHFPPGTGYSYCNCNFRIVSELIENETGEAIDKLYSRVIWEPAGMKTAVLTADTRHPEDHVVGYEGSDATGYFPADNGVYWIGDAGISAALDDMLAYEAWIDATRDDPDGIYNRLSVPPVFADGTLAKYGYGLAHGTCAGVKVTGHGGALRGFRAHRTHAASERLSVVVLFNHEGNAHAAASNVMSAALGHDVPATAPMPDGWAGQWLCPETGLLARIEPGRTSAILRFATSPDQVAVTPEGGLSADGVTLAKADDVLTMRREGDNITTTMAPLAPVASADGAEIAGRYETRELGAAMTLEARDGGVYACFEGLLGTGRMERVHPVGRDVWVVATRRSMDAPAPGDWTLSVSRDAAGQVSGLTLGCWLARKIGYVKIA
ncbi:MAG: D-aminopeptidase [Cypionkella sp.]